MSPSRPKERLARTIKVAGKAVPYPEPSTSGVSAQMKGNRGVDTSPERRVRSLLHRQGLRFRKNSVIAVDAVRVRPDIVFRSARVAVFIDGCFWHGCPVHGRTPQVNRPYWRAKLARNLERDNRNGALLTRAGWVVLRYWEHEEIEHVARSIATRVRVQQAPEDSGAFE